VEFPCKSYLCYLYAGYSVIELNQILNLKQSPNETLQIYEVQHYENILGGIKYRQIHTYVIDWFSKIHRF
jgi:hypothetical protein